MIRINSRLSFLLGALSSGIFLGGLCAYWFVWTPLHDTPSSDSHFPSLDGNLHISLSNIGGDSIRAAILLDHKSIMYAYLPRKSVVAKEYGIASAFATSIGTHDISVYLAGSGEIAKQTIIQENNKTNYLTIYLTKSGNEKRYDCRILVKNRIVGAM